MFPRGVPLSWKEPAVRVARASLALAVVAAYVLTAQSSPAGQLSQDDIDDLFVELIDMDEMEREKNILMLCHMYDTRTMRGLAELLMMSRGRAATSMEALLEEEMDEDDQKVVLSHKLKRRVARTLCLIADNSLMPKLREMVKSEDETTAMHGIQIAGFIGSPESVALLKQIAAGANAARRVEAVRSLGNSDSPDVLPLLQRTFQEGTGSIRSAARQALASMGVRAGARGKPEVQERMAKRKQVVCIGGPRCGEWLSWTRHHPPAKVFDADVSPKDFAQSLSESGLLYIGPNEGSVKGKANALFANAANQGAITQFLRDGGVLFFDAGPLSRKVVGYLESIGVTPPGRAARGSHQAIRSEDDSHPITEEPEAITEAWGEMDCVGAWKRWPEKLTAPYRSITNPDEAVLLVQEGVLAGGDVLFSQIAGLTRKNQKSYRMLYNLFTYYFGVVKISPRYFKMSMKVETPHVKWARLSHLGTTKVLYALGPYGGRRPIEIAQRLDTAYRFAPLIQEGGFYPKGVLEHQVIHELRKGLLEKPDVLVVGVYEDMNWKLIPDLMKHEIETHVVRRGMGLIVLNREHTPEFNKIMEGQQPYEPDFIKNGNPFAFQRLNYKGTDMGRGRVLVCVTGIHKGTFDSAAIQRAFQFPREFYRPGFWEDWTPRGPSEYFYAALAKAILWAAHKDPKIQIASLRPTAKTFGIDEKPSLRIRLRGGQAEPVTLRVETTVRDKYEQVVASATTDAEVRENAEFEVALPSVREGHHLADVILRDSAGATVCFGSTVIQVTSPARIEQIRFDRRYYQAPAEVGGTIVLTQAVPEAEIRAAAVDTHGRQVHAGVLRAAQKEVRFKFPLTHALSRLLMLRAELRVGDRVLSYMDKPVGVHLTQDRDYRWYVWGGAYSASKVLWDLGVDINLTSPFSYSDEHLSENWEKALRGNLGLFGIGLDDMKSGCQSSIIHAARVTEKIEARGRNFMELTGGREFLLADEQRLANEQCLEPSCLFLFRRSLKKMYGSLEKLNESWQTDFKEWESVRPMEPKEVSGRESLAPYVDHKNFMDTVFSDRVADAQLQLREIMPDAKVGYSGTQELTVPGYDWWKLMKSVTFLCRYGGIHRELTRSFARPDLVMGQWCGGYTLSDRGEARARSTVWFQFLHRCNMLAYYWGTSANLLANDWTPNNVPTWMSEEVRELKRGLGKLLLHCQWSHEGIAIHYSQPSVHVGRIDIRRRKIPPPRRGVMPSLNTFYRLVERLGLQHNFVSYEQVAKGELSKRGYKVFLMPMSQALSEEGARQITLFAKEGGTVIADYGAGILDEHGAPAKADLLKNLFGISFKAATEPMKRLPVTALESLKITEESPVESMYIPSQVQAISATPLARVGDQPAVLLNSHGKGRAIYLNFLPAAEHAELMRALLARAGVRPRVQLLAEGDVYDRAELFFYRSGDAEYLGLLPPRAEAPTKVEIRFPKASHVYDVRKQKYLGAVDRIEARLADRRAEVFAQMPYHIDGVDAEVEAEAKAGDIAKYKCQVKVSGGAAGMHVFRAEVHDPDGRLRREYCRNLLARAGAAEGEIPLALNDKAGTWRIVTTETVSGQTAECTFTVR